VDWSTVVRTTAQLGLGYLADAAVLDLVGADGVLRREALERSGDSPSPSLAAVEHGEVESPTIREALFTRRTRRILMPEDGAGQSGDPDLAILEALQATSCIVAPLVIRGRAAGVLTLVRRAPSPPHEPEDVALATEIARRAALALDDARLIAEAASEAAARDAFLAAAAHDIRTPLTALRLQVEALERSAGVTEPGRARVARLRGSAERLARRVEQVLDAARAGPRGGAPLERARVDLAELARKAVTRVAQERRGHAPPVRVVAPDPVPGRWDPSRVEGIVASLIGVAAKRGGEEVEVRVTPELRGARIEVHRPGAGDDAPTRYGREAAAHEELEIGVWVARRFAEAHGGRLRVVRLPRAGALFTVDLPG
jgi:signal transduction histidine kinase